MNKTQTLFLLTIVGLALPAFAKDDARYTKFENEVKEELTVVRSALAELQANSTDKSEVCFKLGSLTELLRDEGDEVVAQLMQTSPANHSQLKNERTSHKEIAGALANFCGDKERSAQKKEVREGNVPDLEKVLKELDEVEKGHTKTEAGNIGTDAGYLVGR